MGAWGTGNFQNDDALDWVYELEQSHDPSVLIRTLGAVADRGEGYVEAPECARALVAAETVSALGQRPSPELTDEVRSWVEAHKFPVDGDLVALAVKAIQRIRMNSELKELWDESDHAVEWYKVLDDLERRLKS